MHPSQSRTSEAIAALCIATLGEAVVMLLLGVMVVLWCLVGSGRI